MTALSDREIARRAQQRLLSRPEAASRADLSISTLKREEAAGRFPRKVQITANRVGYVESEVDAYIAERIAERDAGPAEAA